MSIDYLAHEIGNVFVRLAARYGVDWALKWKDVDAAAMVREWRDELRGFDGPQHRVAAVFDEALRNLPPRPVNAPQFRVLCEQAREAMYRQAQDRVHGNSLPVRGPTPEERAKLQALREDIAAGTLFAKPSPAWAYRIVERAQHGEAVGFATLRIATEVVDLQERRNAPPTVVPDAFDAHPSALVGDEPLPALPEE